MLNTVSPIYGVLNKKLIFVLTTLTDKGWLKIEKEYLYNKKTLNVSSLYIHDFILTSQLAHFVRKLNFRKMLSDKKPFSGLKDRICRDSFLPHKLCLCARFEFGYYAFKGFT